MEMAFQYFLIAGAGVGLGLAGTILPCFALYKKLSTGGIKSWRKQK